MVCEVVLCVCSPQLKELLAERNEGITVLQVCLIFAGKILKDEQTLESQGVKDGLTIHLVIRSSGKVLILMHHVRVCGLVHSSI